MTSHPGPQRRRTDRIVQPVSPNTSEADASIYKGIALNAQDVLRVGFVQMMRVDWERHVVTTVTASDLTNTTFQKALEHLQAVTPGWNTTRIQYPPDVGEWARRVYYHGETAVISVLDQASYLTPLVARLGYTVGLRHALIVPVAVRGRVLASLSFTQRSAKFSDASRKTAESFARQAALTLENAQLSASLREQLDRLERSQRLAVEAEERTRREIAELLHGRVQTRLLVAWSQLSDYADQPTDAARSELVRRVCDDLERIRESDVRQASHLLHPSVIRMGLVSASRSLAARVADVLPVSVEVAPAFAALDTVGGDRLSEGVRLVAYRVIEEAIGNTLRHARARRAVVRFAPAPPDAFEVTVEDDGVGFDPARTATGLGFASVDARVHAVQGGWSVHSVPGGPTVLRVKLPLR